jgi:hypothetical protein
MNTTVGRGKILLVVILAMSTPLRAQNSAKELSQAAANPLADLISLPFQNNTNFGLGPYDRTANVLNIQPVVPLAGGRVITRTIFPVVWIPDLSAESGLRSSGLGDVLFTAFYVPPVAGEGIWGFGAALEIPSGGEERGTGKWSLGPSLVYLLQPGDWTVGVLANNVWSFAGDSERASVSRMLINLFLVRQLGDGWYVNSAPIITADWNAASGQQWVVPLGAGAGKLSFVGKLPLNLQVGAFYNIVKPEIGPDWQLRVQAQVLFPASLITG